MSKRDGKRVVVTLRSTAGTGTSYTTTKNLRNPRERLELVKYDRRLRRRVVFRETR